MTPQERALLEKFFADLNAARGVQKDAEAAALIDQGVAANPDAAYLLVQHTILADQALHAAQARIAQLQAQLSAGGASASVPAAGGGSFLHPAAAPQQTAQATQPSAFSGGGGLGSFLRNAGTMAAGVAGGQLLFSGLSDLFGGSHAEAAVPQDVPQDVTINNYNSDPGLGDGMDGGFDGGLDDSFDGGF